MREYNAFVVVTILSLYVLGVTIAGVSDDEWCAEVQIEHVVADKHSTTIECGGTPKVIDTNEELMMYYAPVLILGVLYTIWYGRSK